MVPIALFPIHFISTYMVIIKNKINTNQKQIKTNKLNQKSDVVTVNLVDVLCNEQALHLFMTHLSKEFSAYKNVYLHIFSGSISIFSNRVP